MRLKHKGFVLLLNALVGGGYVAAILLLIQWVSTVDLGLSAFLIPFGLLALLVIGWTMVDRRKYVDNVPRHS